MSGKTTNPLRTIRAPEALRGLDTLVDQVTQIVQRSTRRPKRNPVHVPVQKSA